ncbi:hypothetical protein J5T34_08585 [Cupriavidus gilardii]|uniref:hypothetical protein n=1 Tax=Cupriavidus gilardii TaxID=82541 RepID=UPI001ABE1552|nr:hypothetical protein [Cupriavidus gilardii]MBO4120794.1 hypothetical protein [Cupriavidus gilardii]
MLARLFRSGLILFAVFALVWTATILWWQSIHRMPTTTDIVTHLFLLPAGMIAGYLVIRRALDGIRRNVAAAVSTPAAAAQQDANAADGAAPDDDPSRRWRALVLGAVLHTAKGADTAATAAATAEQQRPDVVDVLGDGMPIFAAPVDDIDVEGTREALERTFAELPWNDEAVRAVALASDVAERLVAQTLEQHPALYFPAADETTTGPQSDEPPRLVLTLLLPERWEAPMAAAAGQYVRGRLTGLWPIERISMETLTAKGDGDAMVQVDRAILALHREPTHELRGVIAADSHIGAEAIDRLRATNRLFSAQCEHGVAPSEAAAGVLLYPPQGPLAAMLAQDTPPASILRATLTRLDAPTPDKGQPRTAALDHAVAQTVALLAQSADSAKAGDEESAASPAEPAPAPQPVVVAADISPHPVRTVELARVFSERFDELDVSADLLPVGTACGHTGNAGALLAIVLAHQQCAERGGPALAVTAADPQQRGAIAVVPPPTA